MSTFLVGALALVFMAVGAASGGPGIALVFLSIFAALTGLYMLATGRRSWARLPGGRKTGGMVLAVSLVLMAAGGATATTKPAGIDASVASENEKRAEPASGPAASSATPTASPSLTAAGEPLDPAIVAELAQGANYPAPQG